MEIEFKHLPHTASEILNSTDACLQMMAMNNLAGEFDDSQHVDQVVKNREQQSNEC